MIENELDIQDLNLAFREKSERVLREFTRVVNAFNKAFHNKEGRRTALKNKLETLAGQIQAAVDKLETIARNIGIYDQNTGKIAVTLDALREREALIKEQFERLLAGPEAGSDKLGLALPDEVSSETHGGSSRESLVKRRKQYLDGLEGVFRKLEDELATIDGIRKEMERARAEIAIKKEESLETKEILEGHSKQLMGEVRALESELEHSLKQEATLIREFERMVNGVESQIEIGAEADRVLFSILGVAEADSPSASGDVPEGSNGAKSAKQSERIFPERQKAAVA